MSAEEKNPQQESRPRQEQGSPSPRRWRGPRRRKTGFALPRTPPLAVRAIWEMAEEESRQEAHERAQQLFEFWLGTKSKAQVAEELSVTPLRVWQLSQMALSGLVCGLLPQPRFRKGRGVKPTDPDEDPVLLRKRVTQLERELEVAKRLIGILKTLPGNAGREVPETATKKTPARPKRGGGRSRRGGSPGS